MVSSLRGTMGNTDTHEDDVHTVKRVYGGCRWCGFPTSWDPDHEEDYERCEACGERRRVGPFEGIDGEDKDGFATARAEVANSIQRRIAYGVERVVELIDEIARRGREQ